MKPSFAKLKYRSPMKRLQLVGRRRDFVVTPNTHPWLECARQIESLRANRVRPLETELRYEALRVLLWLCSEKTACPHQIGVSAGGSIVLDWFQDGANVRVEVAA